MIDLMLYTGKIKNHDSFATDFISAIDKTQVNREIMLTILGLEDDQQAETKFHGGPDRALCHYPREHYTYWQSQYPEQQERFTAPLFGENISTLGMNENNVHIGDIYRWGEALIQVTQPRSPCYKLNTYLNIENISLIMQESGRCGWLYRVTKAGKVSKNQPLELITRHSDISVAEAIGIAFHRPFDAESCQRLLNATGLSSSWRKTMQTRRVNGHIESFQNRLFGMTDAVQPK